MITIRLAPIVSKIFYFFIFLVGTIPLIAKNVTLFNNQLSYADLLMILVFALLVPLNFKNTPSTLSANRSIKILYFFLFYCLVSTLWSTYTGDYWYVFYQLLLAFLTISIPYLVSKITNDKHIDFPKLISNFSLIISFILLYYIATSNPGDRLTGPIGTAAILSVIIIPVIAVHLHNVLTKNRIAISLIGLFISLLALFFTQSRIGLLMLLLFLVITILRKPTPLRIIALTIGSLLFIYLFGDKIWSDRYDAGFDDNARETMLNTSLEWWFSSPKNFLLGEGYGSVWQWAEFQSVGDYWNYSSWFFTEHGRLMYHAHSLFNQLVGETGLIGLIPFIIILWIMLKETWRSWLHKNELKTNILIALICTLPSFHTDLMIFRNWGVSIVWLFFFFTVIRYNPNTFERIRENDHKKYKEKVV